MRKLDRIIKWLFRENAVKATKHYFLIFAKSAWQEELTGNTKNKFYKVLLQHSIFLLSSKIIIFCRQFQLCYNNWRFPKTFEPLSQNHVCFARLPERWPHTICGPRTTGWEPLFYSVFSGKRKHRNSKKRCHAFYCSILRVLEISLFWRWISWNLFNNSRWCYY